MEQYPEEEAGFDFAAYEADFWLADIDEQQAHDQHRQQLIDTFSTIHPDYNHNLFLLEFEAATQRSPYPILAAQHDPKQYLDEIVALPRLPEHVLAERAQSDSLFATAIVRIKLDFAAHARSLYGSSASWLEAMFDYQCPVEPLLAHTSDVEVIAAHTCAYGISPHDERRFEMALFTHYDDLLDKAQLEFSDLSPAVGQYFSEYACSWGLSAARRLWVQNRTVISAEAIARSDTEYKQHIESVFNAVGTMSIAHGLPLEAWTASFGRAATLVAAEFARNLPEA
jgi:hypothetical protein